MIRPLLAAFALLALLFGGPARAHEASLGMMELREVRPAVYIGRWTMEPTIGGDRVRFRFPPHCLWRAPELLCGDQGLVGSLTIDNLGQNMSALMVRVFPLQGEPASYTITSGNPVVTVLAGSAPTWETWLTVGRTYVNYGIDHIMLGIDHLLFVFGLILIVRGGWRLVETISAFTIGHSISLAAAAFGVIGIPEKPLNACIALSIAFVGVEIVKARQGERGLTARYPWAVAGVFGLVHGIGFASALAGLGIERKLLPVALLTFNVGVEIGQLAFVLLVLALIRAHRRLAFTLPARLELLPAYALGSVAMFWTIGRIVRVFTA